MTPEPQVNPDPRRALPAVDRLMRSVALASRQILMAAEDGMGIPRTCDEVAIVGFAPSTMEDAQFLFGKQNVEIWAINQLYIAWPRICFSLSIKTTSVSIIT